MLIKSLVIEKKNLTTVSETVTLQEALDILESSGYRCIPILDTTGQIFRGNIYKMHIYRHKSQGGDMNLPVTSLLKNATKTIQIDSPFYKVFFNIKDLPYIAVLDENNTFYGILTHSKLLNMLSESWNVDISSYILTISSTGERGDLAKISKIISHYSSINACITLDAQEETNHRRTLITLPNGVDGKTLRRIVRHLEFRHFSVDEIDDLNSGKVIYNKDNISE